MDSLALVPRSLRSVWSLWFTVLVGETRLCSTPTFHGRAKLGTELWETEALQVPVGAWSSLKSKWVPPRKSVHRYRARPLLVRHPEAKVCPESGSDRHKDTEKRSPTYSGVSPTYSGL